MDEKAGDKDQPHFQNFLKAVKSRNYQDLNADVAIGVMSASWCTSPTPAIAWDAG